MLDDPDDRTADDGSFNLFPYLFCLHLFLAGNHLQLRQNVVELDGMKAEVLAAGADSLRNILRLRGRHHEDHVRRWLFESLEQRVEGGFGDLVGFVENIDFVTVAGGGIAGGVAQFANLVNAPVGGGVDLDHVHGVALTDLDAGVAHAAGFRRGSGLAAHFSAAVEGHGHNARNGGFANAAVAGKNVAVGDAVLRERVHQGAGNVILTRYVGKALRTVFSGQNLITHECTRSFGLPGFPGGLDAIVLSCRGFDPSLDGGLHHAAVGEEADEVGCERFPGLRSETWGTRLSV